MFLKCPDRFEQRIAPAIGGSFGALGEPIVLLFDLGGRRA
jgi:hypothetical protein